MLRMGGGGRRREDASYHRLLLQLVRLTIILVWMDPLSSTNKSPTVRMAHAFSPTITGHNNIVSRHPPNGASSSVSGRKRRTIRTTHRLVVLKAGVVVADMDDNDEESSSSRCRRFMYMTPEQDELLKQQGDYEAICMQTPRPLKPHKVRGASSSSSSSSAGGGGGFGSSSGKTKKSGTKPNQKTTSRPTTTNTNPILESYAKALQTDGVVRIDNVLSAEVADALRDYLIDLRAKGTAAIESGEVQDSQERFADVLLNQNRCDLKIPLGPAPVHEALYELLVPTQDESTNNKKNGDTSSKTSSSIVRDVMEHVFESYDGVGKDAELWELNCFMSNAGARRQLVHADVVSLEPVIGLKSEEEPIVLTCFVALQDIDATMGPTVWMPGTHTLQAHNQFFETGKDETSTKTSSYSPKDAILQSSKSFVGTLPKGACVIFDPRVLHCAGANSCSDPDKTRALFYMSFKNPKIDSPGCPSTSGYGVSTAAITMEELTNDLQAERAGNPIQRLQLISCFP